MATLTTIAIRRAIHCWVSAPRRAINNMALGQNINRNDSNHSIASMNDCPCRVRLMICHRRTNSNGMPKPPITANKATIFAVDFLEAFTRSFHYLHGACLHLRYRSRRSLKNPGGDRLLVALSPQLVCREPSDARAPIAPRKDFTQPPLVSLYCVYPYVPTFLVLRLSIRTDFLMITRRPLSPRSCV